MPPFGLSTPTLEPDDMLYRGGAVTSAPAIEPPGPFGEPAAPVSLPSAGPVARGGPFGVPSGGRLQPQAVQRRLQFLIPALVAAFGPKVGPRGTAALLTGLMQGRDTKLAMNEHIEETQRRRAFEAAEFRMNALKEWAASETPEELQAKFHAMMPMWQHYELDDPVAALAQVAGVVTVRQQETATAKQKAEARAVITHNDQTNPGQWSAPDETGTMRAREWWVTRAGAPGLLPGKAPRVPTRAVPGMKDGKAGTHIVSDEPGTFIESVPEEPDTPASIDAAILMADRAGNHAEAQRLMGLKRQMGAAGRAPAAINAAPSAGDNGTRALAEMTARTGQLPEGTPTQRGAVMRGMASDPALLAEYEQTRMEPIRAQAQTILSALDDLLTPDGALTPGAQALFGEMTPVWSRNLGVREGTVSANASLRQIVGQRVVDLIREMKSQSGTGATGFGQLNRSELDIILSAATRLTQRLPEAEAAQELAVLREKFQKILQPSGAGSGGDELDPLLDELLGGAR